MELSLTVLLSSKKLLTAYNARKQNTLRSAKRVLSLVSETDINKSFQEHKIRKLTQSGRLINSYKEKNLYHFDIFRKAGFLADENSLSDAIAAILDPRENHQLGVNPLLYLLDEVADHNQSKISSIKGLIRKNISQIILHRERRERDTIPDIEIVCSDFLIFIENKIRGGSETFIHGLWQTDRQWEALIWRSRILDIPEENIIAFYLTPEGKLPKNRNFFPLSVSELVSALRRSIINLQNFDIKCSLLGFLNYYAWE